MSALTDAAKAATDLAASLTALDPLQVAAVAADAAEKTATEDVTAKSSALLTALTAAGVKTA